MRVLIRSIILFVLIPLLNSILYGIMRVFYEPTFSEVSTEAFERYRESTVMLLVLLFASIIVLESIYSYTRIKDSLMIVLYTGLIVILAFISFDQFAYRPYEHSLTFFSICLVLLGRLQLKKLIPGLYKRASGEA